MDNSKTAFVLDADLLTLRSFIATVELGSFSAAAKQVGRSQSAVSLQIANLEDRMQVNLLERTSRSVKLTQAGEIFISYAKKILELSDEGLAAVSSVETTEPLRLGFAEYILPQHLEKLLSSLKKIIPNSKIELKLGVGFELYDDLKKNNLDIIVVGPEANGGEVLFTEPLVWVGVRHNKRDKNKKLDIVQMKAPCSYRKAALDSLKKAGIMWNESVSLNTIQGILSAVYAGFGVSALPKSAVDEKLEIIRDELPKLPETSMNVYWNTINPHPLNKRFIALLKEELKSMGFY